MNPLAAVVVAATLLADTTAVLPGKPFRLGIMLAVPAGWHIHWSNSGDSGGATRASLELPAGMGTGPLHWPVPRRFVQPGGGASYGYARELFLWWDAGATPNSAAASFDIRAEASWTARRDADVPGTASLRLVLPAGAGQPAHGEVFDAWGARAQRDATDPDCPAQARWSPRGTGGRLTLKLNWNAIPGRIDWVAPADPGFAATEVRIASGGGVARVTLRLAPRAGTHPGAAEIPLLVAYTDGHGTARGITIRVRSSGDHRNKR